MSNKAHQVVRADQVPLGLSFEMPRKTYRGKPVLTEYTVRGHFERNATKFVEVESRAQGIGSVNADTLVYVSPDVVSCMPEQPNV